MRIGGYHIGVTITGADDQTNPLDLVALSDKYPFVEWGVLNSHQREGSSRYPREGWIRRLLEIKGRNTRVALHLCGERSRQVMGGEDKWFRPFLPGCGRIQLNGYVSGGDQRGLRRLSQVYRAQFVLQCRDESDLQMAANEAALMDDASVLWDRSGGHGKEEFDWPRTPAGCRLGFAGGIGPDNVLDVLKAIGPRDPFWIDMESGVRDANNSLHLGKVVQVLEQVAKLNRVAAPDEIDSMSAGRYWVNEDGALERLASMDLKLVLTLMQCLQRSRQVWRRNLKLAQMDLESQSRCIEELEAKLEKAAADIREGHAENRAGDCGCPQPGVG